MSEPTHIVVRNARTHNLRGVDVEVPRHALVVFTGVSGSGKSSLVFDTIHQEGQRRFVESLSPYARQFLGQVERPEVDAVEGVSPTLSIDQKTVNRNPRSTVGTITEIFDHFRLLLARLGTPHCPVCDTPVRRLGVDQVVDRILAQGAGRKVQVLGPVVQARKGEYRKELEELARQGWARARIDGVLHRLDDPPPLDRYVKHTIEVVVDRLVPSEADRTRLTEAVETGLRLGRNVVGVQVDEGEVVSFSTDRACPHHPDQAIPELEPRLFSFNSPQGACPDCQGLGAIEAFEPDLLLDRDQPIATALRVLNAEGKVPFGRLTRSGLLDVAKALGVDAGSPVRAWPAEAQRKLVHGDAAIRFRYPAKDGRVAEAVWTGVVRTMDRLWGMIRLPGWQRYRSNQPCRACRGSRLGPIPRAVRFRGHAIDRLAELTVDEADDLFSGLVLRDDEREVGALLVNEIRDRLGFLREVGLGYLSLSRSADTLSGGESQRIRLASQVGSGLQGVTYVLDEPSIGLHPRDNQRLLAAIRRLRDRGNSVLVVEHDEETILAADWVIDVGPGAGREGGHVLASGPPAELLRAPGLTAAWLRRERTVPIPAARRPGNGRELVVRGARLHNLHDVDLAVPMGALTVVTGVSGSGKSTLVFQVLEPSLQRALAGEGPVGCRSIDGVEHVEQLVRIGQSPIGRTPRSNAATYTGAMDIVRDLFAQTAEARARGYGKGHFSFNVPGGRCEDCEGAGVKTIEMQFLPDVQVPCESCGGRRFAREVLDVTWKGRTIADVLALTVAEALEVFGAVPKLRRILQTLHDVGLDYVALGQPSTTLSGGEAQRVKLATELHRPSHGRTVYLLDEPTTGLHFEDVAKLLRALDRLVEAGNTVLVVEHHTDVIKVADHVVDLGPEGGSGGGRVVGQGTPEEVAALDTPTGRALAAIPELSGRPLAVAEAPARAWAAPSMPSSIRVRGARLHNLQDVDVEIPHGKLTVITGPSGSGKTSLAFDTVFAEGQRRYVESLSTYARRFLGRLDRAPVEKVEGLQPAIAIDQGSSRHNPRSTVATVTEIHDVLRILYARAGDPHCPHCDRPLAASSPSTVARRLAAGAPGTGWLVTILPPDADPAERRGLLLRDGRRRLLVKREGAWAELDLDDEAGAVAELAKGARLVLDRLAPSDEQRARIVEAVVHGYHLGHGLVQFVPRSGGGPIRFTEGLVCPDHGPVLPELTPRHFSFNSRLGMCAACEGLGVVLLRGKESACPRCGGARLRPEVLAVRLGGRSIHAFAQLTVVEASDAVASWTLGPEQAIIAARPRVELAQRLRFLVDVGLGYLTLDRRAETLSGGESQRIRLASQLGSRLSGVTYVLDEPTVGLHPRDTDRLLATLEGLRDLGNTVLVVEHDPDTIARADHVIDMGPAAGRFGGHVTATGSPAEIAANPASLTGRWLAGVERIPPRATRRSGEGALVVRGARANNLRAVTARIPLGAWTAVTGPSGSGKSSLVMDTVAPALRARLGESVEVGPCDGVEVDRGYDGVVVVDQTPIGRTPRSTPATFVGLMDKLRELYAGTLGARTRGYGPGRFSFNALGGRCEACEGRGAVLVEMHFLPDVWVVCDACRGKRFSRETLEVRWQGLSIADVLTMRSDEALAHFQHHRGIRRPIQALVDVGLGYLALGQPGHTLSGGEAQRIKLAAALVARSGHRIHILDEPTTGLHLADVEKLVQVLHKLVDAGHTVITIAHHLDLIAQADHVLELGPDGGSGGGSIVAEGPPEAIVAAGTCTGLALAGRLDATSRTVGRTRRGKR